MFRIALSLAVAISVAAALAAAADKHEKTVAENAFKSANKNNDQQLDDSELREGRRILKAALRQELPNDVPGGKAIIDKVEALASRPLSGSKKDGKTSLEEWTSFVKASFDKRDDILKDAKRGSAGASSREAAC